MRFSFSFSFSAGAVLLSSAALVSAISFNPDDEASIKAVTKDYAFGLMSYYKNNATNIAQEDIGIFPRPHYWWAAGAAWGGMIEYSQFTGDVSYVKTLHQALVANYGPNKDILLPWRKDQEGNDDQAFWALSLMSALEFQFPDPQEAPATYLEVVENAFNNIVSRWDTGSCNGGLKWQIYPENAYGYNYKNSISNGATFALGARLARYTGNAKYADWATKIFEWTKSVGLVTDKFEVFDGADDKKNCADFDRTQWTYNIGMFLHGSAVMYNYTNGEDAWKKRTSGFIDRVSVFTHENTDVLSEVVCEENGKCNLDQQSFKAYFARFLGKTAIMAPFTRDRVTTWLKKSAVAAAKSCSGGKGTECGFKWYTGSFDGVGGTGQQLSALEVTQALLMLNKNIVPATKGQSKPQPSSSAVPGSSTPAKSATPTATANASSAVASSTAQTKAPTSAASSTAGYAASSVAPVSPSGTAPGNLLGSTPVAPGVCTCTPSSTVTIYVPATPPPSTTVLVVVPTISTRPAPYPNGTISVPPPANTTGPVQFQGTATNTKMSALSILSAVVVVMISGLL